jgi:D-alanyl-D-alanine carboxypeptidase
MNISTALDLLRLVFEASHYSEITQASRTAVLTIKSGKQSQSFNNTNPIVGKRHSFIVSKTGTTNAAGGCIVMMVDTDVGRRIVIVLGSKNGKVRIPEAEFIVSQS